MGSDAICGGGHTSHFWTLKEIKEHEPCLDCYCGVPFKRVGAKEYRYYSCPTPVGERCKKHNVIHKSGSGIWKLEEDFVVCCYPSCDTIKTGSNLQPYWLCNEHKVKGVR